MSVSERAYIISGMKFYSLLGILCLSLTVDGIIIGYNIMIRKRNAKRQQPANHQESRGSNLPGVSTEEANRENYQELRDMRRSEIYDTV